MLAGWVDARRDHGKLIFIDVRDRTGIAQVVFNSEKNDRLHKDANRLRPEWVVQITGTVQKRPEAMKNPNLATGAIEIAAEELMVLAESETPPFDLTGDGYDIGEEHRLTYRYLDLRRPRLAKNLHKRHEVLLFVRNFLGENGFTEVETPILTKSTPEGARDYIVPSRLHHGMFYALPQSPQQYKQLLMVAGFENYFQIARCFRDEDTRGDRQPEFTQIDMEISFVTQDDILELAEEMYTKLIAILFPEKHMTKTPWPRLDYEEVMREYGTDKPDMRRDKNDPNELAFAWILNFPLFESKKIDAPGASIEASMQPSHHMFTAPKEEDIEKLESEPHAVHSYQHDLALNGYEVGGGSMRIHDPEVQKKIFDLIGFSEEQKNYFAHLLRAFTYGVPPHGGIALGFDRFAAIMLGEPNIREVIAFPKTGDGRDLMMGAPAEVEQSQLKELGIKIKGED
ncbi:MAG: aspartate--tRNA ligase [Patescibacteria group bacterium]